MRSLKLQGDPGTALGVSATRSEGSQGDLKQGKYNMRNTTEPRHRHYHTNNEDELACGPSHIPARDYRDQEPVPLVQRGLPVSAELTQDHTRFSEDLCLPPLDSIKLILQNKGQR